MGVQCWQGPCMFRYNPLHTDDPGRGATMAKKKTPTPKGPKMPATAEEKAIGHARLELPRRDFERLRRAADARGISISAYIRQATLLAVKRDEAEGVSE